MALARLAVGHSLLFQDAVHSHQRTSAHIARQALSRSSSAQRLGGAAGSAPADGTCRQAAASHQAALHVASSLNQAALETPNEALPSGAWVVLTASCGASLLLQLRAGRAGHAWLHRAGVWRRVFSRQRRGRCRGGSRGFRTGARAAAVQRRVAGGTPPGRLVV